MCHVKAVQRHVGILVQPVRMGQRQWATVAVVWAAWRETLGVCHLETCERSDERVAFFA